MADTLRQRKPLADAPTAEAETSEAPTTPTKKKPRTKKRVRDEDDDEYNLWLEICRIIVFLLLLSFGLSYLISNGDSWFWGVKHRPEFMRLAWWKMKYYGPVYMTLEDLAQYDGTDLDKPIYLSINGDIYDVSAGRHIYGPGGSYHWFAGVDASRGFVTGCFSEDRNGDLRGVEQMFLPIDNPEIDNRYWTPAELEAKKKQELEQAKRNVEEAVNGWASFFAKSHKYHLVGKLVREPGWEGELKPLCDTAQKKREPRKPPGQED